MEKPLGEVENPHSSASTDNLSSSSPVSTFLVGLVFLLAAAPVALLINNIQRGFPGQPEKAILMTGIVFGGMLLLPVAGFIALRRKVSELGNLAILFLSVFAILLTAVFLYQKSFLVAFPADLLSWTESDFINDILKLKIGYPLFSAQANHESFVYPPGPQVLTYLLASLLGQPFSIPVYRGIQIFFTLLAALTGYFSVEKLIIISSPQHERRSIPAIWGLLIIPVLFLISTNSLTNPFTHNLHDDALALLASSLAYLLLLAYVQHRKPGILVWMALIPAVGFWVKQSLLIWAGIYLAYLILFDRPRSLRRILVFGLSTAVLAAISVGAGFWLWGNDFKYWIIDVLGAHGVSPLRSFQHLLQVWPYLAIGLFGGYVLLRGQGFSRLLGPWLVWLGLTLIQIYTSGIAWMINHIGPGSLIAGVWFLAGLVTLWPQLTRSINHLKPLEAWLRIAIIAASFALLTQGLGLISIPIQPVTADNYRYIAQIEQEFSGVAADQVLLDAGTWVYLPQQVVMKDRAPTIGERGYSQTADFSGILSRIENQAYAKILVRNLHKPDFWYDHELWESSSGIRQALLANYVEDHVIPAVEGQDWYMFQEISVLLPK